MGLFFYRLSRFRDLNPRPFPYHGNALPAELKRLILEASYFLQPTLQLTVFGINRSHLF